MDVYITFCLNKAFNRLCCVATVEGIMTGVSKDDKANCNPHPLDYFCLPLSKSLATGLTCEGMCASVRVCTCAYNGVCL